MTSTSMVDCKYNGSMEKYMMMMMYGQKTENRAVVGNKPSLCFTS